MGQIGIKLPGEPHCIHVLVCDVLMEPRGEESDIERGVMTDYDVTSKKCKDIALDIFNGWLVSHHFIGDSRQAGNEAIYLIFGFDELFVAVSYLAVAHSQDSNLNHLVIVGGKAGSLRVEYAVVRHNLFNIITHFSP